MIHGPQCDSQPIYFHSVYTKNRMSLSVRRHSSVRVIIHVHNIIVRGNPKTPLWVFSVVYPLSEPIPFTHSRYHFSKYKFWIGGDRHYTEPFQWIEKEESQKSWHFTVTYWCLKIFLVYQYKRFDKTLSIYDILIIERKTHRKIPFRLLARIINNRLQSIVLHSYWFLL